MGIDSYLGDNAELIFTTGKFDLRDLIESPTIRSFSGIEHITENISLFEGQYNLDLSIIDTELFSRFHDVNIETKIQYYADSEYIEDVSIVSLNSLPFMVLIRKGNSSMEHIISSSTYNLLRSSLKKSLMFKHDDDERTLDSKMNIRV